MHRSHVPAQARLARRMLTAATAAVLSALLVPAVASAANVRIISYRGYGLAVPAGWPVYNLSMQPRTCVRFNRHAVYLGVPGDDQLCPPDAAGRTEAILVEPAGAAVPPGLDTGAAARLTDVRAGVSVLATWRHAPGLIRRALGVASLASYVRAADTRPAPAQLHQRLPSSWEREALASPASGPASPGGVYLGLGFDACSAPNASAMTSWEASPYGAIGIYIGGANAACVQSSLTAAWVAAQSAAGWHMLPLYVGLQAPGNSCGCAAISPASATVEGSAAAANAVVQAQALGIGPGNPIYFDMEAYTPGSSTSAAVLMFLSAWTTGLQAAGYLSGVYASEDSGVADLVKQVGTGYTEPDELWIANWNGSATTTDPLVPTAYWLGERLHQFAGATNQTYGGATIDVDEDAIDAATAATGSATSSGSLTGGVAAPATTSAATTTPAAATTTASVAQAPPTASSSPTISGAPLLGQRLSETHATWSGTPTAFAYQWEDCATVTGSCTAIAGATAPTYTVGATDVGHAIRVVETAADPGGTGAPAISEATRVVKPLATSGYWLLTAFGNVVQSPGAGWFGSAVRAGVSTITGIAPTPTRHGYWLVDKAGRVFSFGNARPVATGRYGRAIRGIVTSFRGAWLYTAAGNVFAIARAPWYGSALHSRTAPIVGMASTRNGRGYWLVDATGKVYAFGDAPPLPPVPVPAPVRGIVAAPGGGVWLFTVTGAVIPAGGAVSYGSPAQAGDGSIDVIAMTPTVDGRGYWLLDSAGQVLPYGDAALFPVRGPAHPIVGITS